MRQSMPHRPSRVYLHRLIGGDEGQHEMEARTAGGGQEGTASAERETDRGAGSVRPIPWVPTFPLVPQASSLEESTWLDPNAPESLTEEQKAGTHICARRKWWTRARRHNLSDKGGSPFYLVLSRGLGRSIWMVDSGNMSVVIN